MNKPNSKDFFPEIDERDANLAAPGIYEPYRNDEEDNLHEERLKQIETAIAAQITTGSDEELGELPSDADADRKRWDALDKDFERVFDEAPKTDY